MKKIFFLIVLIVALLPACHKDIAIFDKEHFRPNYELIAYLTVDSLPQVIVAKTVVPGYLDSSAFVTDASVKILPANGAQEALFLDSFFYSVVLPKVICYTGGQAVMPDVDYTVLAQIGDTLLQANTLAPQRPQVSECNFPAVNFSYSLDSLVDSYIIDTQEVDSVVYFYKVGVNGQIQVSLTNSAAEAYYLLYVRTKAFFQNYVQKDIYTAYPKIDSGFISFPLQVYVNGSSALDVWYLDFLPYNFQKDFYKGTQDGNSQVYCALFSNQGLESDSLDLTVFFNAPQDGMVDSIDVKSDTMNLEFYLLKVSKEVYNAMVSTEKYNESGGYNPFVEPVNIYSNVKGGYGVVGAIAVFKREYQVVLH